FWVAADHRVAYEWALAGGQRTVNVGGTWWAAVPRNQWQFPDGQRPDEQSSWDPRFGDRCQQLVFIGRNMDEADLRACLDECLLPESRLEQDGWKTMPNPFPPLT
ncbi:MAG: GTP-binding protein, partial [Myxococcota bacterium]